MDAKATDEDEAVNEKPAVGRGFWHGLVWGCGLLAITAVLLIVAFVVVVEVLHGLWY